MSPPPLLLTLLILLGIANATPILAQRLAGGRWDAPVDLGAELGDGGRLFGEAKTWRGVGASLVATAGSATALGLTWEVGTLIAAGAMLGDLSTSFVKRRLRLPVHARALGLDQTLEALLPLLAVRAPLALSWVDIGALVGAFLITALLLSRIGFRLGLRDRPH